MKTLKFICFIIPVFLFLACINKGYRVRCAGYKIINATEHKISLFSYKSGNIDSLGSIDNLKAGDYFLLGHNSCGGGNYLPPFISTFARPDSIILYFNDTLRVVLLYINSNTVGRYSSIYGEKSPFAWEGWERVKISHDGDVHHFEYEFTDWHYQEALRAHEFDVE